MKRVIFTVILILAFCFAVLAQANENLCQKIKINAPESIQAGATFSVSASFENENQPSTSKFDWTIINENEVIKISESGIIKVNSKNLRDVVEIIILTDNLDKKCQIPALTKVLSVPNFGSPYILTEYSELSWNEERGILDAAVFEMNEKKDMKLLAYIYFNKKDSQAQRKNYLIKFLNHISEVRNLEKNRVTLLISESDSKRVRLQPVPKQFSDYYCDDNCLVIKAEDFDRLKNLFQSNSTNKKRKKQKK